VWNLGSLGAEMLFPPMLGTHPGTVQLSLPTVLFQASDTELNAALNGALIQLARLENVSLIRSGIPEIQSMNAEVLSLIQSHAEPAAFLIQSHATFQMSWNQVVLVAMM